jgi:malate synthase
MSTSNLPKGVHFTLSPPKGTESIISTEAIEFLTILHRTFDARRKELLENRNRVQADLDAVRFSGVSNWVELMR